MNKIKYISLEDLKKHLVEILEDVYKYEACYIVMINNEPKVKLSSLNGKDGKEIVVEEASKSGEENLKKFIE